VEFAAQVIHCNNQTLTSTISIGVSEYKEQFNIEMLIDEADKALYEAKDNGRNCVKAFFHSEED